MLKSDWRAVIVIFVLHVVIRASLGEMLLEERFLLGIGQAAAFCLFRWLHRGELEWEGNRLFRRGVFRHEWKATFTWFSLGDDSPSEAFVVTQKEEVQISIEEEQLLKKLIESIIQEE